MSCVSNHFVVDGLADVVWQIVWYGRYFVVLQTLNTHALAIIQLM